MNPIVLAAIAGVLLLAALGLLWGARRRDARNYILAKATPLPLRLANVRDDVWLDGRAICESPVTIPHFGIPAIYYDWKKERQERRTHKDSKGRTHTRTVWVTEASASEVAPFRLVDGEESIEVRSDRAKFDALESLSDRVGSRRHTAHYFPIDVPARAVGTISEGRAALEPYANVPLIVTRRTRAEFLRSAERGETCLRCAGFIALWLATGIGAWLLIGLARSGGRGAAGLPPAVEPSWGVLLPAAGIGVLAILPFLAIHIRNTLHAYRIRADNAWRQIDVDLMERYELIPRLVEVARAYAAFEREILERLARLRAEAVEGGRGERIAVEGDVARDVASVIGRVERYPDLKAQPAFARLHRELVAIEEKIAHGRGTYNEAVREYNDTVQTFPRSLVAAAFGFRTLEPFRTGA
ncbi:MAG: LemA family protein [Planctomycetes bacterium]|nr:LemA family protein [Planctomycetota bacterium]